MDFGVFITTDLRVLYACLTGVTIIESQKVELDMLKWMNLSCWIPMRFKKVDRLKSR